jgi:hypothetical protein
VEQQKLPKSVHTNRKSFHLPQLNVDKESGAHFGYIGAGTRKYKKRKELENLKGMK